MAPPPADLRTAEMLGARVASVSRQLHAGRLALQARSHPADTAALAG